MKLTVFGGTGATGRILIEQALQQGHAVVAYVRDAARLTLQHPQLKIVVGDLQDAAAIGDAIAGADAVISLLGPKGASPGQPIAKGMRHIVEAMQRLGVRRIVATATPSAADPRDGYSFGFRLAVALVKLSLRSAYDDIVQTAATLRGSGLDWTLLRLPMLSDGPAAEPLAGYVGAPGIRLFWLSRATLARYLLAQAGDRSQYGEAPLLCDAKPGR